MGSDLSLIESFTQHPAAQRVLDWGQDVAGWIRNAPPWARALVLILVLSVPLVLLIRAELRTSYLQSTLLSQYASGLTYQVDDGPSPSIRFPTTGPFNERLGYVALPAFIDSLTQSGRFAIERQARVSDRFAAHMDIGLAPPYVPKQQAGLDVLDRTAVPLASARYPQRVYAAPDSIPRLVRETLLFIENRALLDPAHPRNNPAIEWRRFAHASGRQLTDALGFTEGGPGGSTLATQLDKVRNSPDGQTAGSVDKLRQMASASVQSYLHGPETVEARQRLVAEYLNLLPLAAIAGHGEVNGLGDGLWAWYNTDLDTVNRHLHAADTTATPSEVQALAYRQVLQLILSTRSPSRFLRSAAGHEALASLADRHLPALAEAGIISPALRDAAQAVRPERRTRAVAPMSDSFIARKAASATRIELMRLLSLNALAALDRLDLTAHTHYDAGVQRSVAALLAQMDDPDFLRQNGLTAFRMLDRGDPSLVEYAVVLYERRPDANVVRLQADTFDGPFDINRGSKLELGSTAKLRTLVTYLELIDELYTEHAGRPADSLRAVPVADNDALTRWVLQELVRTPDLSRRALLEAAMNRRYSASPYERFFTGGGQHRFSNFSTASDSLRPTVTTAFRQSINLPFIRMMRDIVNYHTARLPGQPGAMLDDPSDERRAEYLARFADQEGSYFLNRFYAAYPDTPNRDVFTVLGERHPERPAQRLAWAYRAIDPSAPAEEVIDFLRRYARDGEALADDQLAAAVRRAETTDLSWQDRGYLAGIHPLELWLAHYLRQNPESTRTEMLHASAEVRQEVYRWLFQRRTGAQDTRIRTILEQEAFVGIHKRWARLGYPFERLVPTYATSIGSSADRPDALTELVGIIMRDGVRYPMQRIDQLHFAAGTPFETLLTATPASPDTVLAADVAAVAREAMVEVVERGTAVRARGAFADSTGTPLVMGGKTGTGDNRIRTPLRGGGRTNIALNRTSTFVFFAGDRFFGTVTAYAPGPEADAFRFTSSLPAQVLTLMGPFLTELTAYGEAPDGVALDDSGFVADQGLD